MLGAAPVRMRVRILVTNSEHVTFVRCAIPSSIGRREASKAPVDSLGPCCASIVTSDPEYIRGASGADIGRDDGVEVSRRLSSTCQLLSLRPGNESHRPPQQALGCPPKGGLPRTKRESILASVTSPVRTQNPLGRGALGADLTPGSASSLLEPDRLFCRARFCGWRRVRLCKAVTTCQASRSGDNQWSREAMRRFGMRLCTADWTSRPEFGTAVWADQPTSLRRCGANAAVIHKSNLEEPFVTGWPIWPGVCWRRRLSSA